MAYLLVFGIIVAFTLATASLYRYGNVQRQHPLVTLSVLTAWCFSFLIVFTIPLDVTSVRIQHISIQLNELTQRRNENDNKKETLRKNKDKKSMEKRHFA